MIFKVKDTDAQATRMAEIELELDSELYVELHSTLWPRSKNALDYFQRLEGDVRLRILQGLQEKVWEEDGLEEFLTVDR